MDKTRPPLYEVGEIIIDTRQRCLRQNGAEQHLRVQAFQTLTYLIEHRDRVVPKEELFHVIWKDAIVSEDTLVQCIGHVRRALGDDAQEPRHIKTIAKVGYRFVGPVAEVGDGDEAVPRLRTVDTPGTSSSAVRGRSRWNAAYGPMGVLVAFTLASGGVTTPHGSSASVEAGMSAAPTDNLEAFRSYSVAVDKANAYDTDGALRLLERAVSLDPGYAMAYARIGYIYASVRVNEGERAKPYLEKAFQLKDRLSEKERLFIDAWYASAQSDNDGEARALRRLIAAYPRETEGYWRLGYRLAYLDQIDEAIAVYERGLAVDPDAKEIWNALGFHYNAIGRYADAIAAHQRYVALDPREPNAHDSLGITYDQAGRYSDALASIDRALALNPRFHFAVVHKGDSYVQLGRYREALEQYRRYVELAPSDWDRGVGSHHMALVYWRQGDLLNADRAARQEHRFNHDFGTTLRLALARRDWSAAAHWERRYFGTPESPATGTVLTTLCSNTSGF